MSFRLAHFTDIHLTTPPREIPWRLLRGKRFAGWINLRLLGRHDELADAAPITRAFVEDVEALAPDHVLFTGDATGLSLRSEFEAARRLLEPLGARDRISGIPGNHDVYVTSAVRERLYETHLGDWERSDWPDAPPIVRLLGQELALICLKDCRPTALHDSSGCIGEEQLRRLGEVLADARLAGRRRIVALHYAPLRHDGRPDSRLHGLRDGRAFLELVDAAGVDLVVHGHLHARLLLGRGARRPVPMTTPGSLTHRAHDRAYHVYHVEPEGLRLEARRYDEGAGAFVAWPEAPGSERLL